MIYTLYTELPYLLALALLVPAAQLLFRGIRWFLAMHFRQLYSVLVDRPVDGGRSWLNPLRLGQQAEVRTSLNTILLRTTVGIRLWAVAANLLLNAVLWIIASGEVIAAGWPGILISTSAAIACLGLFLYEARVDYDRLIIRKWGLLHREYLWADLRDIRDNKHFEYILWFGETEVHMPKHLVGVQGFLTFIHATIAGNTKQHARTARS